MSDFDISSLDGLKLSGRSWLPDGAPRAAVCLVHGLGEHSGRYCAVAETFNRAGFALHAIDLRGHGKSAGRRGHAKSYAALLDDIYQLLEWVREHHPAKPVFLYGHSLGGNLVIHYALRRLPKLAGVVASSPLLRTAVRPPAWKLYLMKIVYGLLPGLTLPSGLDTAALSRTEAAIKQYREDPLVHGRVSARLGLDMLRSGLWNLRHAADMPCPILVMHGKADRITSARASREFALGVGDKATLKIWPGCFHELHQEPEKEEVLAYLIDWISRHS
jgi:alpha-beta hydrolase superfamily lysophospholipase